MHSRSLIILFVLNGALLALAADPDPARAQIAELQADVVSGGAGAGASDDRRLFSTLGSSSGPTAEGAEHRLSPGFWPQVRQLASGAAQPSAAADAITTDEDVEVIARPLDNDSDPAGGTLSISAFTQPDHGTVSQVSATELAYAPDADFHGEDAFTYTVRNQQGGSAVAAISVTVNPVNDAPRFVSEPATEAAAGAEFVYAVEADDVDGDELELLAEVLPAWLAFTDNGDGTGLLEGTPANEDAGVHAISLEATDGELSIEQTFDVTVAVGVPAAPVLIAPADGSIDVPAGVTFTWSEMPGATGYDLQLALDEGFASTLIDTLGLVAAAFDLDGLSSSTTYFWRVRSVNAAGASPYGGPFSFTTATEVSAEASEVPAHFVLDQNYPNPFNPTTKIAYALPVTSPVRLAVYNAYGREVATLVQGTVPAGRHEVTFESARLASGVYFYRLEAGPFTAVRRMLFVK